MRVCLMIEGQEDVTWDQWVALARACEDAGLEGMFRSDHYLSVRERPERGSLDAWVTLGALAAITSRIRLGTLVSPATFRHPSVLAKSVVTVDEISGGRIELGIGAGWHEAEHTAYGFPFPPDTERLEVLEEQIEIVHRSWADERFDFKGRHYRLEGLDATPKPVQRPHPNLIVGGSAGGRSTALAARWADEYNTIFVPPEVCRERRQKVARAWKEQGRDPSTLVFSLMTGCVLGRDGLDDRGRSWITGTVDQAAAHLREFEDAGVERVMLQHQDHRDLDMVARFGELAEKVR